MRRNEEWDRDLDLGLCFDLWLSDLVAEKLAFAVVKMMMMMMLLLSCAVEGRVAGEVRLQVILLWCWGELDLGMGLPCWIGWRADQAADLGSCERLMRKGRWDRWWVRI